MCEQRDDRVRQDAQCWNEAVEKSLAKHPERKAEFQSLSDLPVERLYTPADVPELDYARDLGFPGSYPFTRGVQSTMYRGRFWTMRQFSGF
ncbi:MAG: methylmalonyl-CoA mutase family protein, partial [Deferrisomatales bacterium]